MHSKNTSYRADIDGLRAVAVLLVLLFHFDLGVSGGFVGVDVFFVISGYLITEVIRNAIHSKRFSFSDFYIRRLLRLQPALIVTIGLCLVAGFLLMDPASFSGLATSAEYSILSASNFYFWLNQGYFDASAQTQPLLHTWSLATEWQFYLVWPFIVWAALKLSDRFLLILLSVMTVVSLAASQIMLDYDSSAAYFMMPFRVFELSIGGMLVFAAKHRASPGIESATVIAGLLLIIGSAFLLDSTSPFPGLRALVPCLGAAACIYAGRSKAGSVLRLSPMVNIGLISYSIYLIHWPIVVFYKYYVFRDLETFEKLALLTLAIAAGALLYRTVEKMFMGKTPSIKPIGLSVIASATMALIACSSFVINEQGMKSRVPEKYLAFAADPVSFHTNNYGGSGYELNTILGESNGKIAAVIGGDSFALQYASGIDAALKGTGQSIPGIFIHGCILSGEYTRVLNNAPRQDCRDKYKAVITALQHNNTPLILAQHWSGYQGIIANSSGENVPTEKPEEYIKVILDSLNKIRADIGSREFVIIGTQPLKNGLKSPVSCLLRPNYIEQKCESLLGYLVAESSTKAINSALAEFANSNEHTTFIDVSKSLCPDGYCSPFHSGKVLYSDAAHLSIEGSAIASKQILTDLNIITTN